MRLLTFDEFWDAANVVLAYRDHPQMLFGEARAAFALYLEDYEGRTQANEKALAALAAVKAAAEKAGL